VERHHDGQMLHVQAEWGVCGLFSSSLQCGFHYLECFFFFFFLSVFGFCFVLAIRGVGMYNVWWFFGRPRSAALWKMMPMCLF
jgi:hypothetical protein